MYWKKHMIILTIHLQSYSRMEDSCVSLMYFFKLFSPAGEIAQKILLDNAFIAVTHDNNGEVVCITNKGREVIMSGGVREFMKNSIEQASTKKLRVKKIRTALAWAACFVGVILVTGYAFKR